MKTELTIIKLRKLDAEKVKFQQVKKFLGNFIGMLVPIVNINMASDLSEIWIAVENEHVPFLKQLLSSSSFFNGYEIQQLELNKRNIPFVELNFSMN